MGDRQSKTIVFFLLLGLALAIGVPTGYFENEDSPPPPAVIVPVDTIQQLSVSSGEELVAELVLRGVSRKAIFKPARVFSNPELDAEERRTFTASVPDSNETLSVVIRRNDEDGEFIAIPMLFDSEALDLSARLPEWESSKELQAEPSDEKLVADNSAQQTCGGVIPNPEPYAATARGSPLTTLRGNPPARVFEITVDYGASAIQGWGLQSNKDFIANAFAALQSVFLRELGVTLTIGHQHYWLPTNYTGPLPSTSASESYTIGNEPMTAYDPTTRLIQMRTQWSKPGFIENVKDAVLLMSNYSLNGAIGVAFQGAACSIAAPAIVRKGGSSVSDVRTIGHELGHLLGGGHSISPTYIINGTSLYDIMFSGTTGYIPGGFGPTHQGYINNNFAAGTLNCLYTSVTRPWIRTPLTDVTIEQGQPLNVTFDAGGGSPLSYLWRKSNGSTYSSLPQYTTQTLSIPSVTLADAGYYDVEAINPAGSTGKSGFTLTVIPNSGGTQCRIDLNNDGSGGVDDLFLYLSRWFQGDPSTDWNNDGNAQIDDLFLFLNAYFVGC